MLMECEHKQNYWMRVWTRDRCYVAEAHQLYWMMTKCKHIIIKKAEIDGEHRGREKERENKWASESEKKWLVMHIILNISVTLVLCNQFTFFSYHFSRFSLTWAPNPNVSHWHKHHVKLFILRSYSGAYGGTDIWRERETRIIPHICMDGRNNSYR